MFSKQLQQAINRNPYTVEWRTSTAISLKNIGMSEDGIINAIEGKLDSKTACISYCNKYNLPFDIVWQILN